MLHQANNVVIYPTECFDTDGLKCDIGGRNVDQESQELCS